MQNPFNFNSLRRNPRSCYTPNFVLSQNYNDSVLLQNYGVLPYNGNQYDFFTRQFQNELELKHHFNSLLNICPSDIYNGSIHNFNDLNHERRNVDNSVQENFCDGDRNCNFSGDLNMRGGNSVQWYSSGAREDHDDWSPTHNTQQQHKNGGSWVTFNNV